MHASDGASDGLDCTDGEPDGDLIRVRRVTFVSDPDQWRECGDEHRSLRRCAMSHATARLDRVKAAQSKC